MRMFVKQRGGEEIGNMCPNRSTTSNKTERKLEEGQERFL